MDHSANRDESCDEPFRDSGLPIDTRVEALLARLTLDEKVAMLHQWAPPVDRLGIASFRTGTEVLHGAAIDRNTPGPTVFVQGVGLGATWNPALLERVGAAVGAEVRALHHRDPRVSLNVWGPVVNLLRDPRWGRNEEGYSEDPFHTTVMAMAYCRGLTGDADGEKVRLTTAPVLKHFLAYNKETGNVTSSSQVRPRVLREYDLRPFEAVIRSGHARGVMPSYSALNGRPNSLTPYLRELRRWQPDLVVVTDAFAPSNLVTEHHYYDDRAHAYAAAIHTGIDNFTDHDSHPEITLQAIRTALEQGLLDEEDINRATRRMLRMRLTLGEFDPPAPTDTTVGLGDDTHRELALEVARQAVVLLRNEDSLLPLTTPGTVAVIGPLADQAFLDWYAALPEYRITPLAGLRDALGADRVTYTEAVDRIALRVVDGDGYLTGATDPEGAVVRAGGAAAGTEQSFQLIDWGEGHYCLRSVANGRYLTRRQDGSLANTADTLGMYWDVYETFRFVEDGDHTLLQHVYSRRYAAVTGDGTLAATVTDPRTATRFAVERLSSGADDAAAAARAADTTIVVVGSHPRIPGRECHDRVDLRLSDGQETVLRAAHAANPRTVAVLVSGFPLAVPWAAGQIPALLWTSHGAQELGSALADVITGACAPAGRLPQTWYHRVEDVGDIDDYDLIRSGKTYLYLRDEPLYPFGHGLTYTTFDHHPPRISGTSVGAEDTVTVSVEVANTGSVDADEVVQLYVRAPGRHTRRPLRELQGFQRVPVAAGRTSTVEFTLPVRELAFWDVGSGEFRVEPGEYLIMIGASATDIRQTAMVTVEAAPIGPRRLAAATTRAVDFDDHHGVRLIDEIRRSGEAIEAVAAGSWLLFRDADLPEGTDVFVARTGRVGEVEAAIEVRLDDPVDGRLVARADVPVGDDGWRWATVRVPATAPAGRHDVYLVFTGPARLAGFVFGVRSAR